MIKQFIVENYKNFGAPLVINFDAIGGYQFNKECLCEDSIGKMLVYGRNGTGKTNLGHAIMDIALAPGFLIRNDKSNFLNADNENDFASFSYTFQFGKDTIIYKYEKTSYANYKSEILFLNDIEVFNFDYINDLYDIANLKAISAETIVLDRFIESKKEIPMEDTNTETSLSFLRWIFSNVPFPNESPISEMRNYIAKMRIVSTSMYFPMFLKNDSFIDSLDDDNLTKFETFLNEMGVECKLQVKELPDGQKELYFKHKKLVPFFENASSGTLVLYNLYRRIVSTTRAMSFCFFDEFDALFHYEMSERFLNYFKQNYPQCQIIFTTHNTNLMSNDVMRPDCLFILSQKGVITPLNKATTRELREGHNLEKMYISGEFDKYE